MRHRMSRPFKNEWFSVLAGKDSLTHKQARRRKEKARATGNRAGRSAKHAQSSQPVGCM